MVTVSYLDAVDAHKTVHLELVGSYRTSQDMAAELVAHTSAGLPSVANTVGHTEATQSSKGNPAIGVVASRVDRSQDCLSERFVVVELIGERKVLEDLLSK